MWLAGNSIGKEFTVTSFGESHGKMVGVVIDGCPSGLALCEGDVQADLDRRIPLQKPELVSGRVEKDVVQILSGVFNGFTTGAPICMVVENKQTRSTDYESLRDMEALMITEEADASADESPSRPSWQVQSPKNFLTATT